MMDAPALDQLDQLDASSSRSISASRLAISQFSPWPTAIWRPRRGIGLSATRCRACAWCNCAISSTRCRSICGSSACQPRQGDRRSPARRARLVAIRRRAACALARERGSRSLCCPARTATIRAGRRIDPAPDELAALLRYFREGGRDNLRALLRRLARHAGRRSNSQNRGRCREPAAIRRPRKRSGSNNLRTRCRRARRSSPHLLSLDAARRRHRAD